MSSCNQKIKENEIFISNDSINIKALDGNINLGKIYLKNDTHFTGIINNQNFNDINNQNFFGSDHNLAILEGIYINRSIFDCFEIIDNDVFVVDPSFDILYIYPEISRYNFQFMSKINYRIFQYHGWFYRENSSRSNLSWNVKEFDLSNDNFKIYFENNSTTLNSQTIDTLKLTYHPRIKVKYFNERMNSNFNYGKYEYFKLNKELFKDININISIENLPQDNLEYLFNEIVTKIINLKYNTDYSTQDFFKNQE